MFETARLKLTAWYVLIILLVSFSFSAFIYNGVTLEFQRRLNVIEQRFRVDTPRGWQMHGPVHEFFVEDLNLARHRVLLMLLYANGVIFVLSAILGNYLAGKALQPIESAMDEQKRFIADASHELKTPLTALMTSIEVALRDKKLNLRGAKSTLKESLDDIECLKDLTSDLLTLTRYQQNGKKIPISKFKLPEALQSAVKQVSPVAKKKGVELKTQFNNLEIKANEESIEKLAVILLDNAIKYTPKGGKVTVATKKLRRFLALAVNDTGVGIPKRDLPHIFERFYRVDQSRTESRVEGFGLGLSVAKKIVDLHNGKISVKSKLGRGSTFIVRLPL